MKKAITLIAVVAVGFLIGRMTGSNNHQAHNAHSHEAGQSSTWTCPMHPQVQQPEFGTCPLCGMDLVPVSSSGTADANAPILELSEHARRLAEVETREVKREFVTHEVRMTGKIAYDDTRRRTIAPLADSLVERLFVNYIGVPVNEGDHLAELYSPEVYTAFREMLVAAESSTSSRTLEAAKTKLKLYGVSDDQVSAALESRKAPRTFTLFSPIRGVLTSKLVNEGDWLKQGMPLGEVTDPSTVWALLDAYESDIGLIHFGQQVDLQVEALPGETFTGFVSFIPPDLNEATRSIKVRLNVPNEDGLLRPGMFVRAVLKTTTTGKGKELSPELAGKWISPMHPEIVKDGPGACDVCGMDLVPAEELGFITRADNASKPPLVIPASAPLITGKRAVVYVQDHDNPALFEGRVVRLGALVGGMYIVESGLAEGERVVTQGAMKIDSTLQIQARPGMMSLESELPPGEKPEHWDHILEAYLAIQTALGNDDPKAAAAGADKLAGMLQPASALKTAADALATTDEIAEQREHFLPISEALLEQVETFGPGSVELYKAYCPMAFGNEGAPWIQDDETILNPYFGSRMLRCGVIKQSYTP